MRCNCENLACDHHERPCSRVTQPGYRLLYVGAVCMLCHGKAEPPFRSVEAPKPLPPRIGQAVIVKIADPLAWAKGARESLDGKNGIVDDVSRDGKLCVRFDRVARPWWTGQTPPGHWHFDAADLQAVDTEVK